MKKRFFLSEEEKHEISNLYSKKNIILEQDINTKQVTVQDIQNKLNQFGFSLNPDGKFGPITLSAATTAMARKDSERKNAGLTDVKTKDTTQVTTQQTPAPQLKTTSSSLIGPKTVKSEWCIQNTKREDEDCFQGSSQDYQTARSEANRAARGKNYPYKRTETKMGENPYYAIYSYQTLDNYEKKKAEASK